MRTSTGKRSQRPLRLRPALLLLVREKKGVLYPERALYRITLKATVPAGTLAQQTWRGKVVIAGRWSAPGWRLLRSALALVWREAGF